jgi:hypothetical protein
MTYRMFQSIVKGLMLGDNNPPVDQDIYTGLLYYAYHMVGNKAESFHLLTLNRKGDLLRMATGDYFLRRPTLPTTLDDELDLDEELCFAAARFFCSMLSDDKTHLLEGEEIIRNYNEKVYQIFEEIKYDWRTAKAEYSGGRNFDIDPQIPNPGTIGYVG